MGIKNINFKRIMATVTIVCIAIPLSLYLFLMLNGNTKRNYREAYDIYLYEGRLGINGPMKKPESTGESLIVLTEDYDVCKGLQLPGSYCLGNVRKAHLYID